MSYRVSSRRPKPRHWLWLTLLPTLTVCTGDGVTTASNIERRQSHAATTSGTPGTVTDLRSSSVSSTSVTLFFTQVDDGTGQPANYDVRFAAGSMTWWQASSVTQGTCSTPVAGTAIGATLTCTVLGLSPSTTYSFQLVAFRDTLNHNATFGALSNVVSATAAPSTPGTPGTVTDLSANVTGPNSVALSFTQVDDGTGQPAHYDVRSAAGSITWWTASSVTQGTCSTPVAGTAIGAKLTCTVLGLSPSTAYSFQLVAFRGTLNQNATFGKLSNTTGVTTPTPPSATQLAITTQPSATAQSGVALAQQPTIQLRDASNNAVSQSGVVVAAAIGSGSGGTLGGTTTAMTNASGIAQFTNLSLTGSGNYTLVFTASGLTSATSAPISVAAPQQVGCASPQPAWIWCDDFEQDRTSSYFEYVTDNNSFVRAAGVGRNGSMGMRAHFAAGQVSAGALRLAFGKTPSTYFRAVDAGTANYRELYWRVYVRYQSGWTGGGGDKMTRAIVFAKSDWSEAAIGHVWSGSSPYQDYLVLDPASGTDSAGNVLTVGYNDFSHLRWWGGTRSQTPIFDAAHVGQWYCVEAHMKLNTPGLSDGLFELRINGNLEAQRTGMNWVGSYQTYGINALFLENYWNAGSPQAQERYFDDLVVSTQPIGC